MSDLIDRQDAINAIHNDILCKPLNGTIYWENHEFVPVGYVERILLAVPSAEQKTGKWIRTAGDYIGDDVSGFYDYHWSCSECGREAITNDWHMYELSDYCPHCGAKMKGDNDETD